MLTKPRTKFHPNLFTAVLVTDMDKGGKYCYYYYYIIESFSLSVLQRIFFVNTSALIMHLRGKPQACS